MDQYFEDALLKLRHNLPQRLFMDEVAYESKRILV